MFSYEATSIGGTRPPPFAGSGSLPNPTTPPRPGYKSQAFTENGLPDRDRLTVSIDFGATFSGVAYGSPKFTGGNIKLVLNWPGSLETHRKIPTCLLYDSNSRQILAWGLEAKNAIPVEGNLRVEWFKLFLDPKTLRDEESTANPLLPKLPPGKTPLAVISDFLFHMWVHAKEEIRRDIGVFEAVDSADVLLMVPSTWNHKGIELMREAALQAGLVTPNSSEDRQWRDRLRIMTEAQAASVHCVAQFHRGTEFMVCDAGGGTLTITIYKISGVAQLSAAMLPTCGSVFLDLRFRQLMTFLMEDHPLHRDPNTLAYFIHSFSTIDKLFYKGEPEDSEFFEFTCFNVDDPDDPAVGLRNGAVSIPGNLLRQEVFDPVVNQVLEFLEDQTRKLGRSSVDTIFLVGGFAENPYLVERVKQKFETSPTRSRVHRPRDADTASLRGAVTFGMSCQPLESLVVAPHSYLMKARLPAEREDYQRRPAYITTNGAGTSICEKRLQYLIRKGVIVRRSEMIKTKCSSVLSPLLPLNSFLMVKMLNYYSKFSKNFQGV